MMEKTTRANNARSQRVALHEKRQPAHAPAVPFNVVQSLRVRPLSPPAALDFVAAHPHAAFIDVRTEMEFLLIGHALSSRCIPWIKEGEWEVNPHFIPDVMAIADFDTPIVLICRSGNRSSVAAVALLTVGFREVYDVADGFEGESDACHHRSPCNGWRYSGLPWAQC
jgi:rhodanese-related sulfurtransferase